MLKVIYFLLTYQCTYECDHCYLYCGPNAGGAMALEQITEVLEEAKKIGTVEMIRFQGGEPFMLYPIMLDGLIRAHGMGFQTGITTNGYWATSVDKAKSLLKPLREFLTDFSVSDDIYHRKAAGTPIPAQNAIKAAQDLDMLNPVSYYFDTGGIRRPVWRQASASGSRIKPALRGRAVDKLTSDLPQRTWREFDACPYTSYVGLRNPTSIYVDTYGSVQPFCQGLSLGNAWETPLSELINNYRPEAHPICDPLLKGGPALLADQYDVPHEDSYADACHFCYLIRKSMVDQFPQYLTPRQVYGL